MNQQEKSVEAAKRLVFISRKHGLRCRVVRCRNTASYLAIYGDDITPSEYAPPASAAPANAPSLSAPDRARVEWCIATVRQIADQGREKPLGVLYPQAVMVVSTLKLVLQPNIN